MEMLNRNTHRNAGRTPEALIGRPQLSMQRAARPRRKTRLIACARFGLRKLLGHPHSIDSIAENGLGRVGGPATTNPPEQRSRVHEFHFNESESPRRSSSSPLGFTVP
jgi:hypothetical protein